MVLGAASHRLLHGETGQRSLLENSQISEHAVEQQRILAELEEVHQLRERMLQEGMCLLLVLHYNQFTCLGIHPRGVAANCY